MAKIMRRILSVLAALSAALTATACHDQSREIPKNYVCIQSDGCVSFTVPGCKNAGIDYDIQSFTFRITPECIKYLTEKDSSKEGVIFQTYGVNVRYVLLEADEIDSKIK